MWLLLACSELQVTSSGWDAPSSDSGSDETGTTPAGNEPATSTWTDPYGVFPAGDTVLSAIVTSGSECDTYGYEAELLATATGSGTVRFEHHGAVDGCGLLADTPVLVRLDEPTRTATLIWWTGDCDAIYCSDYTATVRGFPSGIWHVEERRAGRVDVIVP